MTRTYLRRGGVAAVAAVALGVGTALPASAEPTGPFCEVTAMSPTKVVLGAPAKAVKFSVKARPKAGAPAGTVCPRDWSVVEPDTVLFSAAAFEPVWEFMPAEMKNADAGQKTASVAAWSTLDDPDEVGGGALIPFSVLRRSTFGSTFNVGPENKPIKKGAKLTVVATLGRVSWPTGKYAGYADRSVWIQFRKAGASKWTNVVNVKTGAGGAVSTKVTATADGHYRIIYNGNTTTGPAESGTDYIDVS